MQKNFIIFFFLLESASLTASSFPHIVITPLPKRNQALYIPSTILTSQTFEKTQQTFVSNALDQAPGLTAIAAGVEGGTTSIRFRGANDGHTLVVIDGIPVNNPALTTNFFDFGHFKNTGIKKVSLLPGSQSLLYGSNAIGGVVVMDTESGEGNPVTEFTQEIGSYHSVRSHLHSLGQLSQFDYMISGERYRIGEGSIWNRKQQLRQSDDFHDMNGAAKLGFQVTPCFHLNGYLSSFSNDVKNNSFNSSSLPIESNISKTNRHSTFGYLRLNWQPTIHSHHLLTVSGLTTSLKTTNVGMKSTDEGGRKRVHHLYNYQLNEQNLVQFALEHETDTQKKNQETTHSVYQNHFVSTYEWRPTKIVTLGMGLRDTQHQIYKNHLTYQLSGKLNFETTELFSSFGTGFRSPSLFEQNGSVDPNFTVIPNKSLLPEKSRSFDSGIEQTVSPLKSKIRFTYFYMHIEKIILYKNEAKQYINVNKRITHGFEGKITTDYTSEINSHLSYTYIRGIDADTKRHPLKVPQHKVGLALYYCPVHWQHFIEGTYVGSSKDYGNTKIGAYFVMRLGTSYELNDHVKFFGRLENVLDRAYEQTYGYGTRGRAIYGGVTLKL